jgi:SAM-dependent methyltransferase
MSAEYDQVADHYDSTHGRGARGERIGADIHRWLGPGTVLEVGVGTGLVAVSLSARGHQVFGLDVSRPMLFRARQRLGDVVLEGDALALPFRDATVGNLVFVSCLHNIGKVGAALAEAARVVVPGGRVVLVHGVPVPDPDDIEEALRPLAHLGAKRRDSEFAIMDAARGARLRQVADTMTGRIHWRESPDEVAAEIEARDWSYLRNVDEATWREHVVAAIDLLHDLPRARTARDRGERFAMSVFERPAM